MAKELRQIIDPNLAVIVEVDGEPAGVALVTPNLNEAIRDLNGRLFPFGWAKLLWRLKVRRIKSGRLLILGVKKEFRTRQYLAMAYLLCDEIYHRARERGYQWAEFSWTLETNTAINTMIHNIGIRPLQDLPPVREAPHAMKVLVTGASGFLGSHIAEQLARQGHTVRVLVRRTSDRSFLRGFETEEALGDVTQPESLPAAVAGVDAVVHAAGLVKARSAAEFQAVNAGGTANLLSALNGAGGLRRFVLISSLAAHGPSPDGRPRRPTRPPPPSSDYGRSKLMAEELVRSWAGEERPATIIRPARHLRAARPRHAALLPDGPPPLRPAPRRRHATHLLHLRGGRRPRGRPGRHRRRRRAHRHLLPGRRLRLHLARLPGRHRAGRRQEGAAPALAALGVRRRRPSSARATAASSVAPSPSTATSTPRCASATGSAPTTRSPATWAGSRRSPSAKAPLSPPPGTAARAGCRIGRRMETDRCAS